MERLEILLVLSLVSQQLLPLNALNRSSSSSDAQACLHLQLSYQTLCGENSVETNNGYNQGKPGKRGPQGPPGRTGVPGPPGTVDNDMLDGKIREIVQEQTQTYTRIMNRIEALETQLRDSDELIRRLNSTQGLCEIKYHGKCFWIVAYDRFIAGYHNAINWCAERGGTPANIYSEEHYNIVMRRMRARIFSGLIGIHLWLGMRFIHRTGTMTLRDGSNAPFVKWYPGSARAGSHQTHVTIVQRVPAADVKTGMHNWGPGETRQGVLCEK